MQKYLTVVSAVLSDAKRNEIIETNPVRMVDLPDTFSRYLRRLYNPPPPCSTTG